MALSQLGLRVWLSWCGVACGSSCGHLCLQVTSAGAAGWLRPPRCQSQSPLKLEYEKNKTTEEVESVINQGISISKGRGSCGSEPELPECQV